MLPLHATAKGEKWIGCRARWHGQSAKAAGSEQSANLLNIPVLIPFSRDDVLPPKQSAKHWFVCSLLQVLVFDPSASPKLISYFNDFNVLLCKQVLKQRCACKELLKNVQTEHGRRESTCSKWGTLSVKSQQFLGWFRLSFGVYAAAAQTSKPAFEGILGLETLFELNGVLLPLANCSKPFVRPRLWLVLQLRTG